VTLGKTGFNPYRRSQFANLNLWVKAGMSRPAAIDYLGAIRDSLQSPNMILDLRVPKSAQYEGVALDTALAQFLAGEISREGAMKQITDRWNEITDKQGRDKQRTAYAASLNIRR
jgi:multiple sugar transport system substrate-binding protein